MKKKILQSIFALSAAVFISAPAWADTCSYLDANGVTHTATNVTPVTEDTSTFANGGWYMVTGEVSRSDTITVSGSAHLILCDGAKLTVQSSGYSNPGIRVEGSNSLTIYAQSTDESSMGKLEATGGMNGAGIGGGDYGAAGTVTINGGIVTANGGWDGGVGIGGGYGGNGGTVTINGGIVTANGGSHAAGIGGGYEGNGGTVTINGGVVTANGSGDGAGIGGGYSGVGGTVTINGGVVTANGWDGGAGIGGGYGGDGGTLEVTRAGLYVWAGNNNPPEIALNPDGTAAVLTDKLSGQRYFAVNATAPIAKIAGADGYATIAAAITAAGDNLDRITLLDPTAAVPDGYEITSRNKVIATPTAAPLCFTAEAANSSVMLTQQGSYDSPVFECSTDGSHWTAYTLDTEIPLANVGDKVYLRAATDGDQRISLSNREYIQTIIVGTVAASGDVTTLLNRNGLVDLTGKDFAFYCLFDSCEGLTTAPELPATTLATQCYAAMFYECTSLTTAPELPATTIAERCYADMFYGCTSLTTAPELPATTLAYQCYTFMFEECTSLTTAPALPATTLASRCYGAMFYNCTSLTTAPALPATTLVEYCYSSMFMNCTSLTNAPALPATTLATQCYVAMFYGCTSLTTAPELPVTNLKESCYVAMFSGCTSLTNAPELPATTLAKDCYDYMFYECTSLTNAPALPATTLVESCYYGMFSGCTHLTSVTIAATDASATDALTEWLIGVAAVGVIDCTDELWNDETYFPKNSVSGVPTGWVRMVSTLPGGESETTFPSEDLAKRAVRAEPPDREAFAAKGIDIAEYRKLFTTVAVDAGNGNYKGRVVLKDEVKTTLQNYLNAKTSGEVYNAMQKAQLDGRLVEVNLEGAIPGLYYSAQSIGDLAKSGDNAEWRKGEWGRDLAGSDGKVRLIVPWHSQGASYYRTKAFFKTGTTDFAE